VLSLVDLVKEYLYWFLFELRLTAITLGIELNLANAVTAKDPPLSFRVGVTFDGYQHLTTTLQLTTALTEDMWL
jgi:hypothetical protein